VVVFVENADNFALKNGQKSVCQRAKIAIFVDVATNL
jgi:hypothetical protein